MNCKIAHIEYYLPEKTVTNRDLLRENPDWNIDNLLPKTGVLKRHVASETQTALDLAVKACQDLRVDKTTLNRCVKFARIYPRLPIGDPGHQFTWSHYRRFIPDFALEP